VAQTAGARDVIEICRMLAACSEEAGFTTRTFLSPPMRDVHARVGVWMRRAGMDVSVDAAGNLRGSYAGATPDAPRLFIGSHLDTVPHAGAFDGILGVVLGVALVERLGGRRLPFAIEVLGFSEEEGVRFGMPFIGSLAFTGALTRDLLERRDPSGCSVAEAIRGFGLDPAALAAARAPANALGYLEFHIEQGPVLESLGLPLGIVDAIVGQSRREAVFTGAANHAGTTPMALRRDALAGAAEWIGRVEREGAVTPGLVATVGRIEVSPGAGNVIAGACRASLDVRHADDATRTAAVARLEDAAHEIARARRLELQIEPRFEQASVAMDGPLTGLLERAVVNAGYAAHRMASGAGHDAMVVARVLPATMLFLRSPRGLSHHPDEDVLEEDVAAALGCGARFLDLLAASRHD
jgi:allantoate deiminase